MARRVSDALLVVGVQRWLGIDLGQDKVTSALADSIRDQVERKTGAVIRNSVHGLDVFEGDHKARFFQVTARGSVLERPDVLVSKIAERFQVEFELTERQRVSLALVNDSLFPMPAEAQLMLRVAAIEALSVPMRRSEAYESMVDQTLAHLNSVVALEQDKRLLTDAISRSQTQSITEACKAKIEALLGGDRLAEFSSMYKYRSRLIHDGEGRGEATKPASHALRLATDLVLADIGSRPMEAD